MIKVNLMKSFTTSMGAQTASSSNVMTTSEEKIAVKGFIKNLFVVCLGALALFGYENYNLPILNTKLQNVQNELNTVTTFNQQTESLKKEIQRYEADLKKLNAQMEFLDRAQKERLLAVDLLNQMKVLILPQVWLKKLQVSGNAIDINGEAESVRDVNEFTTKLQHASFLKDVQLLSTEKKMTQLKANKTGQELSINTFIMRAAYADYIPNMGLLQGGGQ